MARSRDTLYASRHERHISRNGSSDGRNPIKKSGAGLGNWGIYGDELVDVEEVAREQAVMAFSRADAAHKLQLVDYETFENLRQTGQQIS